MISFARDGLVAAAEMPKLQKQQMLDKLYIPLDPEQLWHFWETWQNADGTVHHGDRYNVAHGIL